MVGQEATRQTLLSIAHHDKFSHAYLFCGTRGTGKTTSARILAKAINCTQRKETGDPCDVCDLCRMADEGKLTDIIEIDAASNRGIDEVRSLIERVAFQPNFGKSKIYIIDEVHMMTKEAFNALLKTLEEPPSHAYFILATTEFHKVPETIRSRCQTYFFRNIPLEIMKKRLQYICDAENILYTEKGLEMIASRAAGGLRDAISLLEQSASYGAIDEKNLIQSLGIISPETLNEFMESLKSANTSVSLQIITSIQTEGRSLEEFGKDFLWFLRNALQEAIIGKQEILSKILAYIEIFQNALQKSKQLPFPSLAFEIAIAECLVQGSAMPLAPQKNQPKTEVQNPVPEPAKPISVPTPSPSSPPWEDDMLPPSMPTKETRLKTETPAPLVSVEKTTPASSGNIHAEWQNICQKMPTSIRLNLLQYASIASFQDHHLSLSVSSPATRNLLESEKNKTKIESILSEYFSVPTTVDFDGKTNETSSEEEMTPESLEALFRM